MPANPAPAASSPRRDGAGGVQYVSCISVGRAWALSSDIARSLPPSFTRTPLRGRERTTVYLGLARPNPPAAADYTVLTELERWVPRFSSCRKGWHQRDPFSSRRRGLRRHQRVLGYSAVTTRGRAAPAQTARQGFKVPRALSEPFPKRCGK